MDDKRLEIKLIGRVQGVGLRLYIKEWADKNNINGQIVNCDDGQVDIVMEGNEDGLQNILDLLKSNNLGSFSDLSPRSLLTSKLAKVDKVDYSWGDFENEFNGFTIVRDRSIKKDQTSAISNFFKSIINK